MGSISRTTSGDMSYRMSKAALNMAGRNLHMQMKEYNTIIVQIHPGWVKTDMGGMNAAISVEESAKGIINTIENLTPNKSPGLFSIIKVIKYHGNLFFTKKLFCKNF
ncbi:MAG: hypothetical protein CM1200mP33_2730 [Chloroflexota bacterium]|nr:MAG: hypothetical protein CM1200mP33_2730 [Chloroflexota bacterium]